MVEPPDAERPVPPVSGGQTGSNEHEVAVDLAAFLPEGTELVVDDVPQAEPEPVVDPWDTGAPEPEVPAWALDDEPTAATVPAEAAPTPAPEPAAEPAPAEVAADPSAAALDRIDEELAAVDDALLALDAGAPERSPLLRDLLA